MLDVVSSQRNTLVQAKLMSALVEKMLMENKIRIQIHS